MHAANSSAQVSLEYLLVLAAAFSALLLFLPLLNHIYNAAIFRLDASKAEQFASEIETVVNSFSSFGNGSSKELAASPIEKWLVYSSSNMLLIAVENSALGSKKTFSVQFPNQIELERKIIDSKTIFVVKKQNGLILMEYG